MTQYQLIQASTVLQNLTTYRLPFKTAYSIYGLIKKANEYRDFFIAEEKKLIDEYHGTIDEQGQIKFENNKDFNAFVAKHNELKALEAADCAPIDIQIADIENQNFSAADIGLLDGIINFVE